MQYLKSKKPFLFIGFRAKQLVAAMLLGLFSALSSSGLTVVTTTTQVTDLVGEIGGDVVEVVGLMGPGVDPHLYRPSARDVSRLRKADVIFYSGLKLEGPVGEVLDRLVKRGARVHAVTKLIPEDQLIFPEDSEGYPDPHVWFDPAIWALGVDVVVGELSELEPKHKAHFEQKGAALKARYLEVYAWGQKQIELIPEANRILVTSHDAFNYFGRAFGFQVVAVQGISTVSEAGLADITNMIDFIKKNQVQAIFVESSVSPAAIKRISDDSGAKIGGELFSDAMGFAGQIHETQSGERYDTSTWEGMLRFNIDTIVGSLQNGVDYVYGD